MKVGDRKDVMKVGDRKDVTKVGDRNVKVKHVGPHTHCENRAIPHTLCNSCHPTPTQIKMEDGDNDSLSTGNAHRRLLFLSQLSQGVDGSQRGNPLVSETSIDKSLDVRLLSQMDFFTPAVLFCRGGNA